MISSTTVKLSVTAGLDSSETAKLALNIYRYALNLCKAKDLKNIGAEFDIIRPLLEYKKNYLDGTHYVLSRFWRAVYLVTLQKKSCKYCKSENSCTTNNTCNLFKWDLKKVAKKYNITYQDLKYVLDNNIIKETDMEFINSRADCLELPDPEIINNVISKLINYIRAVVNKKLSFIYHYQNLDSYDFVTDIVTSVTRSLTANDHLLAKTLEDQGRLIQIAKRVIKQDICNIISKYTAQKRNRLITTVKGYESITLSLDSIYENENSIANLHNVVKNDDITNSSVMNRLLKKVKKQVDPDEQLFIDIKLGKVIPKELMNHAIKKSGKHLDSLKISTANRTIFDYLGWSNKKVNEFRKKVKNILEV